MWTRLSCWTRRNRWTTRSRRTIGIPHWGVNPLWRGMSLTHKLRFIKENKSPDKVDNIEKIIKCVL